MLGEKFGLSGMCVKKPESPVNGSVSSYPPTRSLKVVSSDLERYHYRVKGSVYLSYLNCQCVVSAPSG